MSKTFFPPIAVVGLSGVFPQATGADAFWRNIVGKIDATAEVPVNRWVASMEWVYNRLPKPDMAYSRNACLVEDFRFDPSNFLLDPNMLQELDPLHQWVLHASRDAVERACCSDPDRRRMGVILAAIALPTDVSSEVSRKLLGHHWYQPKPVNSPPVSISPRESICGRVVSFPAAIVSRALGLDGVCYTLDAACASSLYALKLACDELQSRRADAMLAGGVSRPDCLYTQIGFSQLRALSASGRCAPFDRSADGLVVGEGAGIMLLKRLEDAVAQGDTIYGVIRGIGLSNDMRGNLLAPESAGQLRAMRMAYAQAGWRPYDVDHIECHGAGTPVGDATELRSLRALWGDGEWEKKQCAIGSIKSMIGHLLTGAGAAGMLKTLLALHHKTLPPSLKYEQPPEGSPLIDGPFRVQKDVEPWSRRGNGTPRRAAVSAFGFGGINAHVLVEEWTDTHSDKRVGAQIEISRSATDMPAQRQAIAIVGMDVTLGTITSLRGFQEAVFSGRSVLTSPPPGRWRAPALAQRILSGQSPTEKKDPDSSLTGGFVDRISIEIGEFQIPPGEIPDILPQQLLMLKKAAGAMCDAGLALRETRERMGVIVGIGFDYEATNFHLRWALPELVKAWQTAAGVEIDKNKLAQWLNESKDDCGPPLTATRTLGALGGIVASRIAREFRFGGPSFVVSAEEASGLRAAEIAMRMLNANEVDAMLVGAVDLNCDERNLATLFSRLELSARGQIRPFDREADGTLPGEGAVALVLKRLDDAIENQDRIYAVVEGIGSAGGSGNDRFQADTTAYTLSLKRALDDAGIAASRIGMVETHGSGIPSQDRTEARALHDFFGDDPGRRSPENPVIVGTLKPIVGHTGAASGLASLVKAALSLFHQTIPPLINFQTPDQEHWRRGLFHMPTNAGYWAHNKTDGPLQACVAAMTSDGQCMHAVLGQVHDDKPSSAFPIHAHQPSTRPLGALPYGLFIIRGSEPGQLLNQLNQLEHLVPDSDGARGMPLETLARQWHAQTRDRSKGGHCLAILADCAEKLAACLDMARQAVTTGTASYMNGRGGVCYFPDSNDAMGRMAFVYPGSGNHYVGMGRSLGVHWPQVLHEMNAATDRFKSQLLPQWYDPFRTDWSPGWQPEAYANLVADPLRTIFGQVLFGGQMTTLLKRFGLQAEAVIGYSLGESAGLFAMGAWPDRGVMLERLEASDLFKTRLTGPCEAIREAWEIPQGQPVQWRVAAVNRSREVVDEAIADLPHVRRLIVNTPTQCVIGGMQAQLETAIQAMKCEAVYLDGVVTVHCDAARPAAQAYKDLHRFPTRAVENVRFYSCAFEKTYNLTSEAAAESITRQALNGFDFPRTIHQAYEDGIRIFVEIGPHCSCTRMIEQILAGKPHLAVAANHRSEEEPLSLLKCLGTLAAAGLAIDMEAVFGYPEGRPQSFDLQTPMVSDEAGTHGSSATPGSVNRPGSNSQAIEIPVGGGLQGPSRPMPLMHDRTQRLKETSPAPEFRSAQATAAQPPPLPVEPLSSPESSLDFDAMIARLNENVAQTARAHEQYLGLSRQLTTQYGEAFALQNRLLAALQGDALDPLPFTLEAPSTISDPPATAPSAMDVAFDREQCLQFAIGSVGRMLGPEFEIVDSFKARVRLPDEPLMLVDRIVRVEGEKLSLGPGRVITEHDVLPGAWYLDGDRAPVCISVEAGQADLFLCAYLGIDHQVKGRRTYRLLDARIRFHRGLPRPGETIQYDIHIDKFVKHEETYLFFFRFEGYIGQDHLITMTEGCAGFFTEEEVRNSGGIILTEEDKAPGASVDGIPYKSLIPLADAAYDDPRLEALRRGDAAGCFGSQFQGLLLPPALRLPDGRMRLIHRIVTLQPGGGRFGKGYIRAEADIHPDDWFLTCHFVDDMVMPGTLMYECCAHALRVLLMRIGWVTDKPDVAYEPVKGLDCRLKCRGPVTPQTFRVHYDVEIKEIGYHPEPYVIADAHMYADGHYIVFFKDMSMQMTGVTHEDILNFWNQGHANTPKPAITPQTRPEPPLFTRDHILAFAVGKPSEAFGRPYEVFDDQRKIARLPGPPYCFMDRITAIEPQPWVLKPDGWVEAQYEMPADSWYFAADRSGVMPFCVLLEIALQPCGWLAAYAGSALHSANDLKFRNLGGKARMHTNLRPLDQTLTMRTRMTKVSEAADMIIEHFDYQVLNHEQQPVYTGNTYFGFFTTEALARQVGLRDAVYAPSDRELENSADTEFDDIPPLTPNDAPPGTSFRPGGLLMPAKALCMIDGIEAFAPEGGPHGLGFIRGYKIVDPQEWFFKAHFYQDPVCPGSLGIESFLQLIKYIALQRWGHLQTSHRFEMLCGVDHQWSYRGQVIPSNHKVVVDAVVTRIKEGSAPVIMADGWLHVDGISIYKMEGYGIKLIPLE